MLWLDHCIFYRIIKLPHRIIHMVICYCSSKFAIFHFFQSVIFMLNLFWSNLATYRQSFGMVLICIHDISCTSSIWVWTLSRTPYLIFYVHVLEFRQHNNLFYSCVHFLSHYCLIILIFLIHFYVHFILLFILLCYVRLVNQVIFMFIFIMSFTICFLFIVCCSSFCVCLSIHLSFVWLSIHIHLIPCFYPYMFISFLYG